MKYKFGRDIEMFEQRKERKEVDLKVTETKFLTILKNYFPENF